MVLPLLIGAGIAAGAAGGGAYLGRQGAKQQRNAQNNVSNMALLSQMFDGQRGARLREWGVRSQDDVGSHYRGRLSEFIDGMPEGRDALLAGISQRRGAQDAAAAPAFAGGLPNQMPGALPNTMRGLSRAYMADRRSRARAAQAPGFIEDTMRDMGIAERGRGLDLLSDQQMMEAESRDLARLFALQQAQYGLGTAQRGSNISGARERAGSAGSDKAATGGLISGLGGALGGAVASYGGSNGKKEK